MTDINDPAVQKMARDFDNAMQRAFKGIRTRKERRASMVRSTNRRVKEQSNA